MSELLAHGFPEAYQDRSVNGYRPIGTARPHHEFPPCERSAMAARQVIDDVQPILLARDPFLNQHGVAVQPSHDAAAHLSMSPLIGKGGLPMILG